MKNFINSLTIITIIISILLVIPLLIGAFTNPVKPLLIYISLFIISLATVVTVSLLCLRLLWLPLQRKYKELYSDSTSELVGLGVLGFVLATFLGGFLNSLASFIIILISELANSFIRTFDEIKSFCSDVNLSETSSQWADISISGFLASDCFSRIVIAIVNLWVNSFNTAFSRLDLTQSSFVNLIFAMILWVFLSKLLKDDHVKSWLKNLVYDIPTRNNIAFFCILFTGIYLSIAAIAAIPSLQDNQITPEAISAKQLESQIDGLIGQFDIRFSEESLKTTVENSPFSELSNILESEQEQGRDNVLDTGRNASEPKKNQGSNASIIIEKSSRQDASNLLKNEEDSRKNLINLRDQLLEFIKSQMNSMKENAMTKYEFSSVSRKGSRETVEHFIATTDWFDNASNTMEYQMSECLRLFNEVDSSWRNLSNSLKSRLTESAGKQVDIFDENQTPFFQSIDKSWDLASTSCQPSNLPYTGQTPARPELGGYLGPFKFVASWLLSTESLPLTLITGLVGFGLLGSACSSFVREQADKKEQRSDASLVRDLSKVIIIGLSAAVLAFLAVMGGLAVFFTTGSNPNPYALLLGCLLAAAFGEDVWAWAHKKLDERLQKKANGEKCQPESEAKEQSNSSND